MKHKNILKRSWNILWQYRALWVFGMLLALTTATAQSQSNYQFNGSDFQSEGSSFELGSGEEFRAELEEAFGDIEDEFGDLMGPGSRRKLISIIITIVIVIFILTIIGKFLHYISQTALIRMVNDYEETEEKYSVRQGFGIGWSAQSWRMFLVDLVIFLPIFLIALGLLSLIFLPLFTSGVLVGNEPQNILSLVTSIGFFFLFILVLIPLSVVLGLLKHFMRRKLVLEDIGIFAAIKQGNAFVWQNFKDIGLMWLITFGINILWPLVLIPLVFLLLVAGGAAGGLVGLITYGVSSGSIRIVAILGGLTLLLVMTPPLLFVGGLKHTYLSSLWTLTYRELSQLDPQELEENAPALPTGEAPA